MKTLCIHRLIWLLIVALSANAPIALKSQCPGDPESAYYFCGSISRSTLNKYLNRSAAYAYVTHPDVTDAEIDQDIAMLQRLQPKWLGRVAGDWQAGQNDVLEFDRAEEIAARIHNEVSPYIILQAGIYEHIDKRVSQSGDWTVEIPDYVLTEFGMSTSPPQYFEHDEMTYFPADDVPDISRIQTQMWFYYRATQYIEAGYEALHMGIFFEMNNNDPKNHAWNSVLSRIRQYAATHARRNLVLIDAHVLQCASLNDRPYYYDDEMHPVQLLFDYLSFTLLPDEYNIPIPNPGNPHFDHKDRLVTINANPCTLYSTGYGGTPAQDWDWSYNDSHPIPAIVELDNGGASVFDCEGLKTVDGFQCNADSDPGMETPEYLTWGFGGESVWFALQSSGYRNYFNTYAYNKIKELSSDLYFRFNLRMPVIYSSFPWPGTTYNAGQFFTNDEATIKWIWDNEDAADICYKSYLYNEFTSGVTGWTEIDHIRTMADVNGDSMADIIGFGESNVIVSLSAGEYFSEPELWYNNDFTNAFNWSKTLHLRKLDDVNGDEMADIIGFDNAGVKVALSNGSAFLPAYYAYNFWGNADGWDPEKHIRETGDFNGDGLTDIIGFCDTHTKVRLSNGIKFVVSGGHTDNWDTAFSYNTGWRKEKHLRLLGDVNGDGMTDVVGFKDNDVWVGTSNGGGFTTSVWYYNEFCYNNGWTHAGTNRILADVNGDGMDDIVGFGYWGVLVAISTGSGFMQADYWIYDFGTDAASGGWSNDIHTRQLADINGDSKADIIGFGNEKTVISLSTGLSFSKIYTINDFGFPMYNQIEHPRLLADIDNDLRSEIIAFGESAVYSYNCGNGGGLFSQITIAEELAPSQINIFPNPAQDRITVDLKHNYSGNIKIYTLEGRTIMAQIEVKNERFIDIVFNEHARSGLYMLVLITDDHQNISSKFVIYR